MKGGETTCEKGKTVFLWSIPLSICKDLMMLQKERLHLWQMPSSILSVETRPEPLFFFSLNITSGEELLHHSKMVSIDHIWLKPLKLAFIKKLICNKIESIIKQDFPCLRVRVLVYLGDKDDIACVLRFENEPRNPGNEI